MRQHRNPRYAPEPLERKLNPSCVAPIPVAANVYIPHTQVQDPAPSATHVVAAAHVTSNPTALKDPVPTKPGDPQPVNPTSPSNPPPPPGNGTPPVPGPGVPGGTGEPS